MCGIVGMSLRCAVSSRSHQMEKVKKVFTQMLVEAQERGAAATGIAMMTCPPGAEKTQAWVLRAPLPASEFVETDDYKNIMNKVDTNCLSILGHTRAVSGNDAVSGAENNKNNHPHVHGNIIGVHNGRIINDDAVWEKFSGHIKAKGFCDSEAIVAMVDYFVASGIADCTEAAIELAINESEAWFALAFMDAANPHKMHIVKDTSTPLSLGWWSSPEITVFSSQWEYVETAYKKYGTSFATKVCDIKKCTMPSNQIITLDSKVRAEGWSDLYVGKRSLNLNKKVEDIIAAHPNDFKTTQGK